MGHHEVKQMLQEVLAARVLLGAVGELIVVAAGRLAVVPEATLEVALLLGMSVGAADPSEVAVLGCQCAVHEEALAQLQE